MKIKLITPATTNAKNGNRITAVRWARMLKGLGHSLSVEQEYNGKTCDLMIALHARRSFDSIRRFHEQHPDLPLIVALTGTDLYRDIRNNSNAKKSLKLATRLIVLQSMGKEELPKHLRAKTRVIYQSAAEINGQAPNGRNGFRICVIGHMRTEKDPMRTAMATRHLPPSSRIHVLHVGRALNEDFKARALAEVSRNPRYRWLGELPYWKTRRVLASSHLLALTSTMEGSSNALSEAIASSVPVVASKISGLVGTLGKNYPGYFPVGDTRALARLLQKAESDSDFYRGLKTHCLRLRPLVEPKREIASWKELLKELS